MFQVLDNAMSAVRSYTRGILVSASNIANSVSRIPRAAEAECGAQARPATRALSDDVDLAREQVNLLSGERAIQANLAVIRASDRTLGVLLDTIA